jgi:glycosyltransferase involved in cell wall biosynthesis
VQARKSSDYLLQRLVPALRQAGVRVEVQSGWVDDLTELFNRARIYAYDSADYWLGRGVTEGFGLPPLEAIACGCTVFSSLNHALADYLAPGETAYQLGAGSLEADVERIRAVLAGELPGFDNRALVARYRPAVIREQLARVLAEVNRDWDRWCTGAQPLPQPQPRRLRWQQRWQRLRRRLGH